MTSVLISGAGIAGPALAYWLRRHGFEPTVVERAPGLRAGGQAVDVRGVALEVVDRMGLAAPLREARTRMRGMSVLDGDGTELMRSTETARSSGRLDSPDVEVLREDLVELLYARTRDDVEYRFGDSVSELTQTGAGVEVRFETGERRGFDLVVGADGLHSTVRRLAFGPEQPYVHHLGMYVAVFTTENLLELDNWQVWFQDPASGVGGAVMSARDNTQLRVYLGFGAAPLTYDRRDPDQQRQLLADRLTGLRWEVPRLLKAMWSAPDFYFDQVAQVRMPTWSQGRVSLLGDAGYAPALLSGQGTSLGLVGAYVLAEELGRPGADHLAAFHRYERRMRPFVDVNQALATENPGAGPAEESVERAKNAIVLDA
ncbi:FAD-dependent monooxygenase [Plantactinospora sp. B5E13]|uniref:FAD-dependent monooxygenase n=1 Tax=Plantactinospora sp. B5E13 TaxID=3153758 RepID=UPI00325DE667